MSKRCVLLLPLLFLFITSCEKGQVYQQYQEVRGERWSVDSMLTFEAQVKDTNAKYNLYLNVRHSGTYDYRNLWLKLYIVQPDSQSNWTRYNLELAEPSGRWLGQGLGDIVDHQFLVRQGQHFSDTGIYHFLVQHDMRTDKLEDIMEIGLRLVKK